MHGIDKNKHVYYLAAQDNALFPCCHYNVHNFLEFIVSISKMVSHISNAQNCKQLLCLRTPGFSNIYNLFNLPVIFLLYTVISNKCPVEDSLYKMSK